MTGAFLWRLVREVAILQENKRQDGEGTLAKILSTMRSNRCTNPDGSAACVDGIPILDHLRWRELWNVFKEKKNELATFQDAPVIVGSKTLRDAATVRLMSAHAKRLGQVIHLYHSKDSIKHTTIEGHDAENLKNLPSRLTREALGKLPLFPGMKVIITKNVSVPFKVANGPEGVVKDIVYEEDEQGN
jgi:ATP-dependent DNA helicase PIF1